MNRNLTALAIRELILSGKLAPGARVVEADLAKQLSVSRTPIRNVLPSLAQEGFLEPRGRRGYSVKSFNEKESFDAVRLRGVLEGLSARMVSENGPSQKLIAELDDCVREGDTIFIKRSLADLHIERYAAMNTRLHNAIVAAANFSLLQSIIDRVYAVPFVAPAALAFDQANVKDAFDILFIAHGHHHAIVEAIKMRDGARAEAVFREHVNHQLHAMFKWGSEKSKNV